MSELHLSGGSGPTVRRMLLGAQLRRLRGEAGLSREEAGAAIRASAWKIHRLENGQVSFKERDVVDLLGLYGVGDAGQVVAFVLMAREANLPGWWQHFGDLLPAWFRAFVDLESAASLIRAYDGQFVPGLLQTEAYCRAVAAGALLDEPAEEVERRVALRLGRQGLLGAVGGPRLWAVVDEAALRRPVGGRGVMRAQVERLVEAASLPRVTLQVLPFGAGAHPAMVGAFTVLRFEDAELPDVVYLEHLTNAVYLDKREEVEHYIYVMENIGLRSASPDQTVGILHRIMEQYEGG